MTQWARQKREIESYNTFFSAIVGRAGGKGLCDIDFVEIGKFVTLTDSRNNVESDPDFVLYNGGTLLLVEVKSGVNVEERHLDQVSKFNEISIEAAEDFLKEAEAKEKGFEELNVEKIEGCIVYPPSCIEQCRESAECKDLLENISDEAAVLTQDNNSSLELEKGVFETEELSNLLTEGIKTPINPKKEVLLTENMEAECLAISICIDQVASRLDKEEVKMTPGNISNLYPQRKTDIEDIRAALDFLRKIGACVKPNTEYIFRKEFLSEIMGVTEILEDNDVQEYFEEELKGQKGLDQF